MNAQEQTTATSTHIAPIPPEAITAIVVVVGLGLGQLELVQTLMNVPIQQTIATLMRAVPIHLEALTVRVTVVTPGMERHALTSTNARLEPTTATRMPFALILREVSIAPVNLVSLDLELHATT